MDARKESKEKALPGWTVLVNIAVPVVALMVLEGCRDFDLSWWIGVPVAAAIVLGGLLWERAIDRKYLPAQRRR